MMFSTEAPNKTTAFISMALLDEVVSAALATAPVELPEPDKHYVPHVEINPQGILLVVTRDEDNVVRLRAESEFRVICAEFSQSHALVFHQLILAKAGVDAQNAMEQS